MGMLKSKVYTKYPRSLFCHIPNKSSVLHRNVYSTFSGKKGTDYLNNTFYPLKSLSATSSKLWYMLDAQGQTLGRLASLVAVTIRGKTSPLYHPAMDMGNYVVVINAEKIMVTGKKMWKKYYFKHTHNKRSGSGRIGAYRIEFFKDVQSTAPQRIIEEAVFGMLPKNKLSRAVLSTRLRVFSGAEHSHSAQKPLDITNQLST